MKSYRIKKGKHYCQKGIVDLFKATVPNRKPYKGFKINVKFDESCLVKSTAPMQINKLGGISQFGSRHKNSIRIGWRPERDRIRICLYYYQNGLRQIRFFEQYLLVDVEYEISVWDSMLSERIYTQVKSITLETEDEVDIGYYKERYHEFKHFDDIRVSDIKYPTVSYPYCGGEAAASVDTLIQFKIEPYEF